MLFFHLCTSNVKRQYCQRLSCLVIQFEQCSSQISLHTRVILDHELSTDKSFYTQQTLNQQIQPSRRVHPRHDICRYASTLLFCFEPCLHHDMGHLIEPTLLLSPSIHSWLLSLSRTCHDRRALLLFTCEYVSIAGRVASISRNPLHISSVYLLPSATTASVSSTSLVTSVAAATASAGVNFTTERLYWHLSFSVFYAGAPYFSIQKALLQHLVKKFCTMTFELISFGTYP